MSLARTDLDTIADDCAQVMRRLRDEIRHATTLETARAQARAQGYAEAMRDFAEDVAASARHFGADFDRERFYTACGLDPRGYFVEGGTHG